MNNPTYSELLQRPEWQKRRLQILERDQFMCTLCGDESKMLHVHHRYYVSRRKPWEYPNWALVTVCKDCHERLKSFEFPHCKWEQLIDALADDAYGDSVDNTLRFLAWAASNGVLMKWAQEDRREAA